MPRRGRSARSRWRERAGGSFPSAPATNAPAARRSPSPARRSSRRPISRPIPSRSWRPAAPSSPSSTSSSSARDRFANGHSGSRSPSGVPGPCRCAPGWSASTCSSPTRRRAVGGRWTSAWRGAGAAAPARGRSTRSPRGPRGARGWRRSARDRNWNSARRSPREECGSPRPTGGEPEGRVAPASAWRFRSARRRGCASGVGARRPESASRSPSGAETGW